MLLRGDQTSTAQVVELGRPGLQDRRRTAQRRLGQAGRELRGAATGSSPASRSTRRLRTAVVTMTATTQRKKTANTPIATSMKAGSSGKRGPKAAT